MHTLRVQDVLKDRILVSRESARLLDKALGAMLANASEAEEAPNTTTLTLDFEGVEGMGPSFVDELLSVLESLVGTEDRANKRCLIITNPPTRLSSKFEAVARGHAMSVRARADGSWCLADDRGEIQ